MELASISSVLPVAVCVLASATGWSYWLLRRRPHLSRPAASAASGEDPASALGSLRGLADFEVSRVLSTSALQLVLLGEFRSQPGQMALVKIKRAASPFDDGDDSHAALSQALGGARLSLDMVNKKYGYFSATIPGLSSATWNVEVVWPADERVIKKHTPASWRLVRETPSLYETATKPFAFGDSSTWKLGWLYAILDGESEQEDILFDCDDFVLLPNPDWKVHRRGGGCFRASGQQRGWWC